MKPESGSIPATDERRTGPPSADLSSRANSDRSNPHPVVRRTHSPGTALQLYEYGTALQYMYEFTTVVVSGPNFEIPKIWTASDTLIRMQ